MQTNKCFFRKFKDSHGGYTRARKFSCPLPFHKLKIRETVLTTYAVQVMETDYWREWIIILIVFLLRGKISNLQCRKRTEFLFLKKWLCPFKSLAFLYYIPIAFLKMDQLSFLWSVFIIFNSVIQNLFFYVLNFFPLIKSNA